MNNNEGNLSSVSRDAEPEKSMIEGPDFLSNQCAQGVARRLRARLHPGLESGPEKEFLLRVLQVLGLRKAAPSAAVSAAPGRLTGVSREAPFSAGAGWRAAQQFT